MGSRRIFLGIALAAVTATGLGYIAMMIEGLTHGYILGLNGVPAYALSPRYPWELQVAQFLIVAAFCVLYQRRLSQRASRVAILLFLSGTAVFGAINATSLDQRAALPPPVVLAAYAGTSPACAVLAGVVAFIPDWKRPHSGTP
ncbi:hypothetical protein [Sinomonas humi]|uniref:Uncharacterized protein n=1 Tax=Sinomonas humi TaxID=1338436 RepID=A0A0B2ASJ8_9MICC|nr:hypothetical protein [Sinomonas humi]KHL04960.1 hypothetical protein LK10_02990 [Sinomonas humi]